MIAAGTARMSPLSRRRRSDRPVLPVVAVNQFEELPRCRAEFREVLADVADLSGDLEFLTEQSRAAAEQVVDIEPAGKVLSQSRLVIDPESRQVRFQLGAAGGERLDSDQRLKRVDVDVSLSRGDGLLEAVDAGCGRANQRSFLQDQVNTTNNRRTGIRR